MRKSCTIREKAFSFYCTVAIWVLFIFVTAHLLYSSHYLTFARPQYAGKGECSFEDVCGCDFEHTAEEYLEWMSLHVVQRFSLNQMAFSTAGIARNCISTIVKEERVMSDKIENC